MNFTNMAQPTSPRGLQLTMYELKAAGGYDQDPLQGGCPAGQ